MRLENLAKELSRLQQRLLEVEEEIRSITQTEAPASPPKRGPGAPAAGEQTLSDRVVEYLVSVGKPIPIKELQKVVGAANRKSLSNLAARLVKQGRIEKKGWGTYQAPAK